MGRTALLAVSGGSLSGAAVLAAMSGSPLGVLLVYLAPLPLLMVGLGLGSAPFGFAAAAGLVVSAAFGGLGGAGLYGGMHVIPSWLIVQQALRPRSASPDGFQTAGHILVSITLLVAFVLVVTAMTGRGTDAGTGMGAGPGSGIEDGVRDLLDGVARSAAPALEEAQRKMLVEEVAPLFIGFSAVTWILMLIGNAVLAQRLLTTRGLNRRPTPHWSDLRLPGWFDYVLVAAALAALALGGDAGFVARNAVIVLLTPYFFVGLAVIHQMARRSAQPGLMLTIFYMMLFIFFVVAAALVAAFGMAEQWLGVRHRIGARGGPGTNA